MDKIARPVGVVLIALVNLVIYIAVLAYWFNINLPTTSSYYGSGGVALGFFTIAVVTYSIVGIIGVICLLVRWRSFRELAMIGWAIECLPFSIICVEIGYPFIQLLTEGEFGTAAFLVMLLLAAIVLFKITSIIYFQRKL